MINVLYPGQEFNLLAFSEYGKDPALPNVVHETEFVDGVMAIVPTTLHTASYYEDVVHQGGGKTPGRPVSTRFKGDLGTMRWRVEKVQKTGGGTGMGDHDVYPDGHCVVASCGKLALRFYQTGCFNGMVPPSAVRLLNAEEFPDVPGRYEQRYVAKR